MASNAYMEEQKVRKKNRKKDARSGAKGETIPSAKYPNII